MIRSQLKKRLSPSAHQASIAVTCLAGDPFRECKRACGFQYAHSAAMTVRERLGRISLVVRSLLQLKLFQIGMPFLTRLCREYGEPGSSILPGLLAVFLWIVEMPFFVLAPNVVSVRPIPLSSIFTMAFNVRGTPQPVLFVPAGNTNKPNAFKGMIVALDALA